MSVEVVCGKCGERIALMKMLKPLRDVTSKHGGRCPHCGQRLSPSEFSLDAAGA
ncbi:MAG: hypothetical protein MPI95_05660 [Nitrosopumilus sp.]|nr:hypothetical protein [Nitrosopumilus sp.]CAI9831799.1 conserved hypothetical protein [Nitrosopumilaceae archaeon]MDA7942149.1 hypothetical protein [Nitrosopumilus sp.]MDA7943986.1 hypothetical protein [Nitrosopumilus sp.]MDA7953717.1 hypothetical protein [Nitrosopumilus sp.]